jgi:hypothetical protein
LERCVAFGDRSAILPEMNRNASRLGKLAKGKKKTLSPAALAQRKAASKKGVAARKKKLRK